MAVHLALMAAPLVLQGIGSIFSGLAARKARKKAKERDQALLKAVLPQLQAEQAKTAMLTGGAVAGMNRGFMAPSGITAANYGPMRPGQMPPGFA